MFTSTQNQIIYCERLIDSQRVQHTAKLFGLQFPLLLEPTVFAMAGRLSRTYQGGLWHFNALSNGGFYMAPAGDAGFEVRAENGFSGVMSGDALGVTVCLYAYSLLSFQPLPFAEVCTEHYHLLRAYALAHAEWAAIARAID
nr:antirestriction protein [uncultured Roseateles sp.]